MWWSVGARLASMLVVCLAAGAVVYDRPLTPFDASLPIVAAALLAYAWVARVPSLELAPVALLIASIAIPDDSLRLIAYGGIVALSFGSATILALRDGSFDRSDAMTLAVITAALFRLVPIETRHVMPELVVFLGVAALLLASSFSRRIPLASFAATLLVAILTPADPVRAAFLPLLLAACCWLLRGGGLLAVISALPLAILAGRWAFPILVVAVLMRMLEERGAPVAGRWMLSAMLVAVGLFTRPVLGAIYVAAGLVLSLNRRESGTMGGPILAYLTVAALLVGWSGLLLPAFPLPITPLQLAIMGGILLLLLIRGGRRIAIPAAALFVCAVLYFPPRVARRHPVDVSLAPGEPLDIPTRQVRVIDLVLSGANLSDLPRGVPVGLVEVLTEHGVGYRREVRIGDVADWGAFREGHRFRTRNPIPSSMAAIRGTGVDAYPSGAGVITLQTKEAIFSIRVTADRNLPPDARLQVESFEER